MSGRAEDAISEAALEYIARDLEQCVIMGSFAVVEVGAKVTST